MLIDLGKAAGVCAAYGMLIRGQSFVVHYDRSAQSLIYSSIQKRKTHIFPLTFSLNITEELKQRQTTTTTKKTQQNSYNTVNNIKAGHGRATACGASRKTQNMRWATTVNALVQFRSL